MNYPKISVIILNWNELDDTIKCLETLKKSSYTNYDVIVVDNGSKGNDSDIIEKKYEGYAKVIRNKENLGYTGGNNIGIDYALKGGPDYVFLLNNDATVDGDCLSHLADAAQRYNIDITGTGVKADVGGNLSFPGRPLSKISLLQNLFYPLFGRAMVPEIKEDFCELFWVNGAAMMISKKALLDVYKLKGRYLNNKLFMYGDEFDFSAIAWKLGYRTAIVKNALIYHKPAKNSGGEYNPLTSYYAIRNNILLARDFLSPHAMVLFLIYNFSSNLGRILKNIIFGRFNLLFPVLCGMTDGYRGIGGKWKYHDKIRAIKL